SVCTNISCMLCGGDEILAHVEKRLGIKVGESTADGRCFLKREEECLAACSNAPMMMVDHVYYENHTREKVDEILDRHKRAHRAVSGRLTVVRPKGEAARVPFSCRRSSTVNRQSSANHERVPAKSRVLRAAVDGALLGARDLPQDRGLRGVGTNPARA